MFSLIRRWLRWIERKLEGEPGPQFLSGKGRNTKKGT